MKLKFKLSLKPPFILYNDNDTLCECGEHKKCVRKINASDNGRLWVENKDHFRCGKVRNQIEELKEMLPSLFSKQDKIMERFIANAKQETTLEDKLKLLVEEWHKRQLHYEEVAEDNITSEHNNRKFTYKAMATRDCWKELLKLIEDEK